MILEDFHGHATQNRPHYWSTRGWRSGRLQTELWQRGREPHHQGVGGKVRQPAFFKHPLRENRFTRARRSADNVEHFLSTSRPKIAKTWAF